MNNERLIDLLAYLNGLTKLANSEVSYTCTREIGECIAWIREEFEGSVEKPLQSYSVEELTDELRKRDGVTGGDFVGPVKYELGSGAKATLIVIEDADNV